MVVRYNKVWILCSERVFCIKKKKIRASLRTEVREDGRVAHWSGPCLLHSQWMRKVAVSWTELSDNAEDGFAASLPVPGHRVEMKKNGRSPVGVLHNLRRSRLNARKEQLFRLSSLWVTRGFRWKKCEKKTSSSPLPCTIHMINYHFITTKSVKEAKKERVHRIHTLPTTKHFLY